MIILTTLENQIGCCVDASLSIVTYVISVAFVHTFWLYSSLFSALWLDRMSNQPAKDGVIPPPISDSKAAAAETKPKKKICCACPDTKKLRDECIVEHGESACAKWIEAHKMCLRAEGFNVWKRLSFCFSFLEYIIWWIKSNESSSLPPKNKRFWLILRICIWI